MRSFQQNLLAALALGLCGLCAWQWYQETTQRNAIGDLNRLVYEESVAYRDATNSMATLNHQIAQMDLQLARLREEARTNQETLAGQAREIGQLRFRGEALTNELAQYKTLVENLDSKLKESYDGIRKQNAALQELVAQRDEFVKKYNDSVKDRNDIVAKYNELAAQAQKNQGGQTNR